LLPPIALAQHETVTTDDLLTRCGLFWAARHEPVSRESVREERLFASMEAMNDRLSEAQHDCQITLYHNDVLTAELWRRYVTRREEGEGNPMTYMSCPVDFRRILRQVPRTYFGNALCFATAPIAYERLAEASLGELALLIREAVHRVKQDYVATSLETLERLRRQRGLDVMEEIHGVPPRHGILVTNISRLPMQGLDFGAGIPTGFRALSSNQRGAAILPAGDGVEIREFHRVTDA
jgi:hypothetical protein